MPADPPAPARPARGRRPATTHAHVTEVALELFDRNGYEETTVDDVAVAAGISRRTLFRYVATKADLVWGEFDAELARLDEHLTAAPSDEPMLAVVRRAVVATNRFGPRELEGLRIRMRLISAVPALVAHSAVRYEEWRAVVARFAAGRLGCAPGDLAAQTVAHAALGAATAAFEHWARDGGDLAADVDAAMAMLERGFTAP